MKTSSALPLDAVAEFLALLDDDWLEPAWAYSVFIDERGEPVVKGSSDLDQVLSLAATGLIIKVIAEGWCRLGVLDQVSHRFVPWELSTQDAVGIVARAISGFSSVRDIEVDWLLDITDAGREELTLRTRHQ